MRDKVVRGLLRGSSVVVGLILVLIASLLAFQIPVGEALSRLIEGAFGNWFGITRTMVKSVPLLLTSLGIVVSWRAGMFNIGGEGQFVVGGVFGAAVAKAIMGMGQTGPVAMLVVLGSCVVGGAIWAWLAGWLWVKRGVQVVISTILLNFIALQILAYVVSGPLQEAKRQVPITDRLPDSMMLMRFDRQTDLHLGVLLAVLAALGIWVFLYHTPAGFKLRLVGEGERVARANRMNAGSVQIRAMVLSGGLCGLAGGIEFLGIAGQLDKGFSQDWGFLGIPVALLGALHPLLAIPSAVYFGALFAGSENMARVLPTGPTMIYVIQAVAVLGFVAIRALQVRRQRSLA